MTWSDPVDAAGQGRTSHVMLRNLIAAAAVGLALVALSTPGPAPERPPATSKTAAHTVPLPRR
jgi:hypothetical protein